MALTIDSAKHLIDEILPLLRRTEDVLAVVGLFYAGRVTVKLLWKVTNAFRIHFWSRMWKKDLVETYGKWAVVTGSSDGIGKAYALELGKRGMNVLLISRTLSKLENVAGEIKSLYGVETEIIAADFAKGRPVYDEIANRMQDKDIGILVNNVGVAEVRFFEELTEDDIWSSVNVNVAAVSAMTRLVLPRMQEKKRGAIINISSIASHFPIPRMQVYAATKAYVTNYTRAIECENSLSGVTIQCIEPGVVLSNMSRSATEHKLLKPSFLVPSAETFAASAIATLGYCTYTTGYWPHGLQIHLLELIPLSFMMNLMKRNFARNAKKSK